jgi:histone H3/H4
MAPKAPTAYFLFTDANRAAVQQELNDAAAAAAADAAAAAQQQQHEQQPGAGDPPNPGAPRAKVSVAVVAKELGARWRALPEDEKEKYKALAKQRGEEAAAAAGGGGDADMADAAGGDAGDGNDQEGAGGGAGPPPGLPRGVVKRIMACDPELKRASADAAWLIGAAAEALLGLLAERGARQALGKRRRTVKLEDLQHVVKCGGPGGVGGVGGGWGGGAS